VAGYQGESLRVLWLCNAVLSSGDLKTTGTWLGALAQQLVASGELTLGNISTGNVTRLTRQDCGAIKQWIVPASVPSDRDGLPSHKVVADILEVVDEFAPNLVHVWGTEAYWGLLTARGYIRTPALLEMQGLKGAIAKNYSGGLTWKEQLGCIGFKEIVKFRSIARDAHRFEKWSVFEREIIAAHRSIATQTDWIRAHVQLVNPTSSIFHADLVLRQPFYQCASWQFSQKPILFCSAAYSSPFKGLHVAIRAAALLKKMFPRLQLLVAGAHQRHGIRKDGYIAWIESLTRQLDLSQNVAWLGSLDASQMCEELNSASAMILPSFVENCSGFMQEAMMVGTPVVASYAGGLPSLAGGEKSALFFPPGDAAMCAWQIQRLLTDRDLANRLSHSARAIALDRNDRAKIVANQIKTYRQVIAESRKE